MNGDTAEDFARKINAEFDEFVRRQQLAGPKEAIRDAEAGAFAAVAFLDQVAGRARTLSLIADLIEA